MGWPFHAPPLDISIEAYRSLVLSWWILEELNISAGNLRNSWAYICHCMVTVTLICDRVYLHWFLCRVLTIPSYSKLDHTVLHLKNLRRNNLWCNLSIRVDLILRRLRNKKDAIRSYHTLPKWNIWAFHWHLRVQFLLLIWNSPTVLGITVLWKRGGLLFLFDIVILLFDISYVRRVWFVKTKDVVTKRKLIWDLSVLHCYRRGLLKFIVDS